MKKILIVSFLTINSFFSTAQIILTVEGTTVNSSVTGVWGGYNVPRSEPTTFTYRNNSFTSVNSGGYMLQAGDEGVSATNNNLDGSVITGNIFRWNGTNGASTTHALFTGYNKNVVIKYNYLNKTPYGILRKSNGMTNTSGGVAYNIVIDPYVGSVAKGINNVNFYNNTFYSSKTSAETPRGLVDIHSNTDGGLNAPSKGTRVFNNVFYTRHQIINIRIGDNASLEGFESDYNLFWCEDGAPLFEINGVSKTFSQWQALGYDVHSVIVDPNFLSFTEFIPGRRLDYGTELGSQWISGLSVDAVWGSGSPETSDQNGTWQVGARIFSALTKPVTDITVTGAGGATSIPSINGTLQLSAALLPSDASDKAVIWTIDNVTGQATINSNGLVTAISYGTVRARATAHDGSGVFGTLLITISSQVIPVTSVSVTGAGGVKTITVDNGTLQLSAAILPVNATNKTVTWSIIYGTGQGTINSNGLVTAVNNGTITARATASDGSGIYGSLIITITNQIVPVSSITVSGAGGATTIPSENGTLQLSAVILPANATNKSVTWSLINGTGQATISSSGLVTAINNGTVTARASSNDGSGVSGTLLITISSQTILVTRITVTGQGGATSIATDNGKLQLNATVLPADASQKSINWSIVNGTGQASINSEGLVTASINGTVIARATALDGSGVFGILEITISNQIIPLTSITVTGAGGKTIITTKDGILQLSASVLPEQATNKTVTWSSENGTGQATINSNGLVTAVEDGTVTARATANDGSGIYGILVITISNQIVLLNNIVVTGEGGATTITSVNNPLQLSAGVLPSNATNKTVSWSVTGVTGAATINADGLVTALENGTVTARATANDGSGIYGTLNLSISLNNHKPYAVIVSADEIVMIFYEDFVSCFADLYNLQGNHLERKIIDTDIVRFSTSHITPGLYIIVLSRGELLAVEKVMVL